MKVEFTSHAVERSLERLGLTGVELTNLIKNKVKPEKIQKKGVHHVWIKGKGIQLVMNGNKIITVWKNNKQTVKEILTVQK